MKLFKRVSAVVASAAMAATMAITASAATADDVKAAAQAAGVQDHNVQELVSFLDGKTFTADQYDKMVKALKDTADKYVAPKAKELGVEDLSKLTEEQKVQIGKSWTEDERTAIIKALTDLGDELGYVVTAEKKTDADHFGYDFTVKEKESGTVTPIDDPVAPTGETTETGTAVAFASAAAVLLACTGLVVVAKKNRQN